MLRQPMWLKWLGAVMLTRGTVCSTIGTKLQMETNTIFATLISYRSRNTKISTVHTEKGEKMTEGEKLLCRMLELFLDENPDKMFYATLHMVDGEWKHEVSIEPKRYGEWRK